MNFAVAVIEVHVKHFILSIHILTALTVILMRSQCVTDGDTILSL